MKRFLGLTVDRKDIQREDAYRYLHTGYNRRYTIHSIQTV